MICDECETVAHCMKNGCVPKTTKKDEALKLALEALEYASTGNRRPELITPAIIALRQAIEQAEQAQPVARVVNKSVVFRPCDLAGLPLNAPLYTAPPPRQPEQAQPVALKPCWYESKEMKMCRKCGQVHAEAIIDTAPPPRQPLTDEQIGALLGPFPKYASEWGDGDFYQFARVIEAAHGIKGEA